MKCGIVKGGLLGLGLGTAALFWVFGGRAVDLVQMRADKARDLVKRSITSFDDDINLARAQVAKLDPAIAEGAEALAKLEDGVIQIKGETAKLQSTLTDRGRKIERLRASLDKPAIQRVGTNGIDLRPRVETELGRAIDEFNQMKRTLTYTQDTLKYREALVQTAHDRLLEMKAKKKTLQSKIDEVEARHKARVASQQFSEFRIDSSPLAEAERIVTQLDRQENISTRTDELQDELSDQPVLDSTHSDRDLRQEADAILKDVLAPAESVDFSTEHNA